MSMKTPALLLALLLLGAGTVVGQQPNGEFRRGDCQVDGRIDLADVATVINYLFQIPPSAPLCLDAFDANDDGIVDLGDMVEILNFVALDGTLPAPAGTCGLDPTADGLSCDLPCGPPTTPTPSIDHRIDLNYGATFPQELHVSVTIDTPDPLAGFSLGVCHDPAELMLVDTNYGTDLAQVQPEFVGMNLLLDGVNTHLLVSLFGSQTIPAGSSLEMFRLTYVVGIVAPNPTMQICPCDTLGTNPTALLMIDGDGNPIVPTTSCLGPPTPPPSGIFARGDCNDSGSFDISDEIFLLDYLFGQTQAVNCADACDNNDDGSINVADAVYGLAYLFGGGPELPDPFQVICGPDPTDDALDCTSYYCF